MEERERCYSFILSRTPHETKTKTEQYYIKPIKLKPFFFGVSESINFSEVNDSIRIVIRDIHADLGKIELKTKESR
jgi:hypothetical protein